MDHIARLYVFNCVPKFLKQWSVIFHAVSQHVDDYDAKSQLFKIVLMLKAFVDGHQNVTLTLSSGN